MTLNSSAWGLELGGSCVRLVRVNQTGSGFEVVEYREQPLEDRWKSSPDLRRAIAGLAVSGIAGPLAVAIPDELVLYRGLSLPQADAASLEKMVRGQLEALVPTQAQLFASAWSRCGDGPGPGGQRVLLCAVRAEAVARSAGECAALGRPADAVVPSAWALSVACGLSSDAAESVALLDVGGRTTTVALLHGGKLVQCALLDEGGDRWTERMAERLHLPADRAEQAKLEACRPHGGQPADRDGPAALLARELDCWKRQVREVYGSCVEAIPAAGRPRRCLVAGRAARTPGLLKAVSEALGLEALPAAPPPGLTLGQGVDFGSAAPAIGAAIAALEGRSGTMNLAPPAVTRKSARKVPWGYVAVAAWMLAGVFLLYLQDRGEARSLGESLDRLQRRAAAMGGLDRQLAIAAHLQPVGALPLAVLDEISSVAPKETMLTSLTYGRDGQVAFAGELPNEQRFQALLEKLRESPMFDEVAFRTAKKDKGKLQFEVSLRALAAPKRGRAAAGPQPATGPQPGGAPASMPTTGPATQPAGSTAPAGPGRPGPAAFRGQIPGQGGGR